MIQKLDEDHNTKTIVISSSIKAEQGEKDLTVNIEEFPDSNDASVDFPTPLPPTIDTNESWVLKSGFLDFRELCVEPKELIPQIVMDINHSISK